MSVVGVKRKTSTRGEYFRFCRVGPGNFTPSLSQIPDVNLSIHTAPDVRQLAHAASSFASSTGSSCCQMASVGPWPRLNNAAPSLQPHYRTFVATTGHSVPVIGVGTLALAVVAACGFSLHATGLTERRFSRSIRKPGRASRRLHAGCRSGRIRTSPELIPEEGSAPGFDFA